MREFPLVSGIADYLLFIDREAVSAVEAKPEGTTLSGVEEQTGGYLSGLPEEIPHSYNPLPFGYESTGAETFFVDTRDAIPRSRRVFAFHRPETLRDFLSQGEDAARAAGRADIVAIAIEPNEPCCLYFGLVQRNIYNDGKFYIKISRNESGLVGDFFILRAI